MRATCGHGLHSRPARPLAFCTDAPPHSLRPRIRYPTGIATEENDILTDAAQRKIANQVIDVVADPDVPRSALGYVGMYAAHNLTGQEHLERLNLLLDSVERIFRTKGSTILGTVPLSPGRLVGVRSADSLEKAGRQLARIAGDVRHTPEDLTSVASLVVAMAPTTEIVERLREVHKAVHTELARLDRY